MENTLQNGANIRLKAVLMLAVTAVLWSFGGILIKFVHWNPVAIAGTRSFVAAIAMLSVLRKPSLKWSLNRFLGALSYALTVILFVTANKFTSAANAILLQYSAPIYIALFGYFFLKEKTSLKDWLAITAVICGMVLFFLDDIGGGNMFGNIVAILSGVAFAFTAIFMRKQKDDNPLENIFWGNVLTALIGSFFVFGTTLPDTKGFATLLILGVFQLGLSYILYAAAIKNVTALEATLIPVIEPILNPIWVFLTIGEKPGKWAIIGGIVVLFSVTARCISQLKSSTEK